MKIYHSKNNCAFMCRKKNTYRNYSEKVCDWREIYSFYWIIKYCCPTPPSISDHKKQCLPSSTAWKTVNFPASKPPNLKSAFMFLCTKMHNFPPNSKISRQGASLIPHFFPLCLSYWLRLHYWMFAVFPFLSWVNMLVLSWVNMLVCIFLSSQLEDASKINLSKLKFEK